MYHSMYLGSLKDELESTYGEGSYITEFASSGPKRYVSIILIVQNVPSFEIKSFQINSANFLSIFKTKKRMENFVIQIILLQILVKVTKICV